MHQHPEKQHWTTTTFTHLCPTLPKRSKAKKSPTREEQCKKIKEQATNICPAETSTNGKGTNTRYKNITILYIKWPLLALAQDYTHIKKCWSTGYPFFSLSLTITACSPNCPTHMWPVLRGSGFVNHLFFTLQNYNSIHIFSSLMLFFFLFLSTTLHRFHTYLIDQLLPQA